MARVEVQYIVTVSVAEQDIDLVLDEDAMRRHIAGFIPDHFNAHVERKTKDWEITAQLNNSKLNK